MLGEAAELRKVSLRRILEAAVEEFAKTGKRLPQDLKFLGGLQRIRYASVYPDQKDIVLVGPGEGWKVEPRRGNIVGVTTGRPVLLLDDLLVALRTAKQAAQGGITCSIDPDIGGRAAQSARSYAPICLVGSDPQAVVANSAEQTPRPGDDQVPRACRRTSHFARILVAADYHMKRLAMNFDALARPRGAAQLLANVPRRRPAAVSNMMQCWWAGAPSTSRCFGTPRGCRGNSAAAACKAMTEEDFLYGRLCSWQAYRQGQPPWRSAWADPHYQEIRSNWR